MATISFDKPRPGGGGRPPVIDEPRGYGGEGGRGDGAPDPDERLKRYRLGVAIGLTSIVMLFVGATVAFVFRQHFGKWNLETSTYVRDWMPVPIPFGLLTVNTVVLLVSSLTMEVARRQAAQAALLAPALSIPGVKDDTKPSPWLAATIALGIGFVSGQYVAWRQLASRGQFLFSGPSSSFFYVLTGTHALHLSGGLLVLVYAAGVAASRRSAVTTRLIVDVATWYWHVMGLLWLYIFALLIFVR